MIRTHVLFILLTVSACSRAPIPTSDQATGTPLPQATATYAYPARTEPVPTATDTAVPSATLAPIPLTPTLVPSSTPTAVLTPVVYDRNPRALLVEADMLGAPPAVPREAHVTTWRLYADGMVVSAAEQAPLTSGLDATVRVGHLSDTEIQNLLAFLRGTGFFDLNGSYAPRPTPPNLPTARISVYLSKTKTVSVYGPGHPGTPQGFMDAFTRLTQAVPSDAQAFFPTDGYLSAASVGSATDYKNAGELVDWQGVPGVRLADAGDGITVSGNSFSSIAALVGRTYPKTLFREGGNAYRVRFVPNLPRALYLSDWVGTILDAPREFEGRVFDITGYFRGWNLMGEAVGTPKTRSDWVIVDATGAIYVTGALPTGLDPSSRADVWSVVRLRAAVVYVRNGTSYLEVRKIDTLTTSPTAAPAAKPAVTTAPSLVASPPAMAKPSPLASSTSMATVSATSAPVPNAEGAIKAVQARFPEMSKIRAAAPGAIGATTNITTLERSDGWDLVFWQGSGDCPAGCIDNRYFYFSVKKDGRIDKAGEYSRLYDAATNSFATTGAPTWGVPKN